MKVSATQKHARMSPRKLRPYARMIQGMSADRAQQQLAFAVGKAPVIIGDVLKSAIANATHNAKIPVSDLKVASILVNQGLVMKRFMPAAKGMAHPILKRTAHVTVIVSGDPAVAKAKAGKVQNKDVIKTVTADQFVASEQKEAKKEATLRQAPGEALSAPHLEKHETEERSVETTLDKQGQAFQKIKMNQKGADKKKTHRRKSIG